MVHLVLSYGAAKDYAAGNFFMKEALSIDCTLATPGGEAVESEDEGSVSV